MATSNLLHNTSKTCYTVSTKITVIINTNPKRAFSSKIKNNQGGNWQSLLPIKSCSNRIPTQGIFSKYRSPTVAVEIVLHIVTRMSLSDRLRYH